MKRNEMHPKSSSGPLVPLATLPLTAFACCGSRPSSTSSTGTKLLCSPRPSLSESRGIESEKSLKALRVTALASSAQSGPKSNLKRPFLCHRASGELQGRSDRESGALKMAEYIECMPETVSRRQMHATPSSTLTHTSVRSSGRRHSKCGMPQPRTPEVIDSVPCTAAVPGIRVRRC